MNEVLKKRRIPRVLQFNNGQSVLTREDWLLRRQEILELLYSQEYGYLPAKPTRVSAEVIAVDPEFCAGKATLTTIRLKAVLDQGSFEFPVSCAIPKRPEKSPAFVHISFRDSVPDRYMPSEEICDHGFAVLSFCYEDVCSDDADFSNGLSGLLNHGERTGSDCGKIALWAWAASRVMDYIETLDTIHSGKVAVIGHSRLGKTALLAAASDERFAFVFSNDSGCSGAAVTRGKRGERVQDICRAFPYWFCENYKQYAGREDEMPFDQHYLLAAIAPRKVYVGSAEEDTWADPESEFLSCIAAGEVYELLGQKGFIANTDTPSAGDLYHEGSIGYHLRKGTHYLSREDWNHYMAYMRRND